MVFSTHLELSMEIFTGVNGLCVNCVCHVDRLCEVCVVWTGCVNCMCSVDRLCELCCHVERLCELCA